MIKMITVPNVTRNTNIIAVFIFHVERGEVEEAKRRMCNVKEECRLEDHGHCRGIKRNVRCEETDKREDRFV